MQARDPSRQPEAVAEFLATVPPFDAIPPAELAALAAGSRVAFYLENEWVAGPDEAADWICCVQRGGVRLSVPSGMVCSWPDAPGDVRGEGECFGLPADLGGPGQACEARALEDTFLVRLPRETFVALARRHPGVAAYFTDALSQASGSSGARQETACPGGDDGDYLFTRLTGEVASHGLVCVARGTDLRRAAGVMEDGRVGSVLVRETSGSVIGIVTDRDLRRAVARGIALAAPVETLMSAPVAVIDAGAPCFDALIRMTGGGIRHLLVTEGGTPVGMVTASDLLLSHGRSPLALLRAVGRAGDVPDLRSLCRGIRPLAAALTARGATAMAVGGILALLAERVLTRLLAILEKRYGPAPARCRWLVYGAAGRREMLPDAGLALAVITEDGGDPIIARAARTYLAALVPMLEEELARCGLRTPATGLCLGDPRERLDPAAFAGDGDPLTLEASLEAFDAREVTTTGPTGEEGSEAVLHELPRETLLRLLAALTVHPAPLGIYQGRLVERDGGLAPSFDLAARGSRPIIAMARLAALVQGIGEMGTLARLERLEQGGHLPEAVCRGAREALVFFEGERLAWMLGAGDALGERYGEPRPESLSPRRRHGCRAAFAAVEGLRLALSEPKWRP
ncbi:putative CBS domain and cyclic nucleotide-regulated nucleotidyltransferase [Solidesulfovibrio fructosivorans JJ]]|uniref:Putative CBS domain and cyclic nucleotide-regulated nucleotidyltransferase n=1 Tax=Solidesulfovibrio fructosivorans JJ] TaxID=596151 RepID=E1JUV7_SOLFR|nr:CBS domain-containing protein [Solidesulfovibrio fructosivorans]EFL51871.1 putative CBS domain and cyclic nucleotide-regulated nucleotidyltransferase [Solidesulfovibrio fructosivorans JJ]]